MLRNGKKFKYSDKNRNDSDSDSETENEYIKRVDNNIYFYSEVTVKSALTLINMIKKLELELQVFNVQYNGCDIPIYLHINSEGGEIDAAVSVIETIRNSKIKFISVIEGVACSAATLISVVCDERIIGKHSQMMIHQLSCGFDGKMNEIEDEVRNLRLTMNIMKDIYNTYTKIHTNEIDSLLKTDKYWDAKKCKKYGLVDQIQ